MTTRRTLRFLLNETAVTLNAVGPRDTLLDWLRLERRLCGAKEGCAEGDCGACTVLVGRLGESGLAYAPVNACIRLMGSLDGCHVVTIEGLGGPGGALHPVQQAMVDRHGSQCGFCTPGIVMALAALWMQGGQPSETVIEQALQGNLCRCTGYAPIIRAAQDACALSRDADPLLARGEAVAAALRDMRDGARVEIGDGAERLIAPADADDLAAALIASPGATLVAGATDVGLWVTKQMRRIGPAIFIGHLDALRRIETRDGALTLGACVSYADAWGALAARWPAMDGLLSRIGGAQVRAMGTIGGNIANGSPIGDMPPPLIALGATLTLRRGDRRRSLPLEDFFLDYGRQDRAPDEFVESVAIPAPDPRDRFAVYKISKRRDEDISAVCAAFRLRLEGGRVTQARLAFGGMAATPRRAAAAEAALVGQPWDAASVKAAAAALAGDFTPLSDWRASAQYRATVAANLLQRFHLETTAPDIPARLTRAG